ncbi:MAG: hypothetical protein L0Z62_14280 [Gemmataceae bacterium]|nr:hypothetical protein [Gemmataceae bacterium]
MKALCISLLVVAVGTAAADPTKANKPRFTVGKDTTVATGPLLKTGHIDYVAALNERLSQSVTAATNANVLLWKAFGPRPEGARLSAEFYKWLGIDEPPQRGEYYLDLFKYMKERLKVDPQERANELNDQADEAGSRPWSSIQYPHLAGWLKANEKPLALVAEAGKRSHYYNPLVPPRGPDGLPGNLLGVLLPSVQKCRELARALSARAMLHLGEGRYDEAWQDLLTMHRLGRHVGKGGTLIEGLVGVAIDHIASAADLTYLDRAKLSAQQLRDRLRDLQQLPPLPAMADKVALSERFMFLDIVMMLDRQGFKELAQLGVGGIGDLSEKEKKLLADINWDLALRNANRMYDRLAAGMRAKDHATREKQLNQLEDEIKKLKASLGAQDDLGRFILRRGKTPEARGKVFGDILITLLMPALRKVQQARDRNEQIQNNLHLAFALGIYQREHKRYPKTLADLAPKYLAQIPRDVFSGQALIYRPSEKGYLLYSVGPNGIDEGGRYYDDDPPGDDPRVRMPLPKRRK